MVVWLEDDDDVALHNIPYGSRVPKQPFLAREF